MGDKFSLSTDQKYELADLMGKLKDKNGSRKLLAISLRHYGYKLKEISLLTGASERSLRNWIKLFQDQGFEGLLAKHYPKDKGSRLEAYKEQIANFRHTYPHKPLSALQSYLKEVHGVEVEQSWLSRYIKKHEL